MILTDVQEKMVAGAEAVLEKTLDYHEATQLFQLTLVDVAIKKYGLANRAAMRLGVTQGLISQILHGKSHVSRRTGGRGRAKPRQERS